MFKEKELVIFDIDRTTYNGSFGNDFIFHLVSKQIISSKIIPLIGFEIGSYGFKNKSYNEAVCEILRSLSYELDGQSYNKIQKEARDFILLNHHKFYDFAYELPKLYGDKFDFLIISLEPDFIVHEIANHLKIKNYIGNTLPHSFHKFIKTDKFLTNKLDMLRNSEFKNKYLVASFGDSESDFELLQNSQHSFLVNPTPTMEEYSKDESFIKVKPENATIEFKKILNLS